MKPIIVSHERAKIEPSELAVTINGIDESLEDLHACWPSQKRPMGDIADGTISADIEMQFRYAVESLEIARQHLRNVLDSLS